MGSRENRQQRSAAWTSIVDWREPDQREGMQSSLGSTFVIETALAFRWVSMALALLVVSCGASRGFLEVPDGRALRRLAAEELDCPPENLRMSYWEESDRHSRVTGCLQATDCEYDTVESGWVCDGTYFTGG